MDTKEMIEYLELNKLSNGLNKYEDEVTAAIIQTLKEYTKLKKEYDELLRVHTQWYEDLKAIDDVSGRTHWKMRDLLDALRAR